MHSYFVVVHPSNIHLHYYSNDRVKELSLCQGDHLQITDEGFYVENEGWFILTILNQFVRVFVSFNDLEEYIDNKAVMNAADKEWKLILWYAQMNQALAERNEEWFKFISRKIVSLQESC